MDYLPVCKEYTCMISEIIKKTKERLEIILSIPKTIYFNFKCFPFAVAKKLPILVSFRIKIIEIKKGAIELIGPIEKFAITIGICGSSPIVERKGRICLKEGRVIFEGKANFGRGISLYNSGTITFGDNFWTNKNCTIWCNRSVVFGENVTLGWNVFLRDSDGHMIFENGVARPTYGDIEIGDHCWICAEASILKNGGLGNDCILGYGSILTKKEEGNNILYIGNPAVKKKENVTWRS